MSRREVNTFRPGLVQLESRETPSIASVRFGNGVVVVNCNNVSSTVVVTQAGNNVTVRDVLLNKNWAYRANQVTRVDVFGGSGNDNLSARTTSLFVRLAGGNGNDTLLGGNGRELLNGGNGNDYIRGGGGDDILLGGAGNDRLYGDDGDDYLDGGDGDDWLNGGAGFDGLYGGAGKDTIISLNGAGGDVIDGGSGVDTFWMDPDDRLVSPSGDVTHRISGFANPGADLTLDGDRISDPLAVREDPNNPGVMVNDKYETFTGLPLFSSQGPSYKDISQGQLGDCWLLCAFGTIAKSYPDVIRQRVVDFGDGTYGVRLGDTFYRVDNDLPVAQSGNTWLQYTAFGVQNSLWVAILEKAYTYYRTTFQGTYTNVAPPNSYGKIEGGFTYDAFAAFGLNPGRLWFGLDAPSPAYGSNTSPQQLSNTIRYIVDNNLAGSVGFQTTPPTSVLIPAHQYILLGYTLDPSTGLVASVTLRNPWGFDGPNSTPVPGNDSNFKDGIVTVSVFSTDTGGNLLAGTLVQSWAALEWGALT